MHRLELRADHVPVEVVQLDVADADVGDISIDGFRKFLVHNKISFSQ